MEVVLSLGSNSGNRHRNVEEALEWLSGLLVDFRKSSLYKSPALGGSGQNYVNAVAIGNTELTIEDLNRLAKERERKSGRDEHSKAIGKVPLDIDIVSADGIMMRPRDFACDFFQRGWKELNEQL